MTRCFVLVGNAVDGEALSTLVVNKLRGTFDCLAINVAPRDAGRLHALSQLTGATLFGTETGRSLRSARPADFGSARSVKSTGRETLFTAHADRLASGVLHTAEAFRPVVRIKVGGATQAEQRWRKSCIQSALASARASMQEGCIPGGGVALIRAAQAVEIRMRAGPGAAGAQVLLDAAAAPLRSIAANAGCDPAWIAAEVGRQGADIGWGRLHRAVRLDEGVRHPRFGSGCARRAVYRG
jgi:chaperonin GroEL